MWHVFLSEEWAGEGGGVNCGRSDVSMDAEDGDDSSGRLVPATFAEHPSTTKLGSISNVPDMDGEQQAASSAPGRGPIRGTDDVVRLLDDICAWYAVHEPSSPVPPLLKRASQLVGLSFAELLQAIAPGGLSEFQVLAGDSGN